MLYILTLLHIRKAHSRYVGVTLSFFLLFFADAFELGLSLCLLLGILHKEPDHLRVGNLLRREDFIKVPLELLASFLNILRTIIGDPKDLPLGEVRPTSPP